MMKNILFDLDGTIINSEEGVTKSIAYALEYYKLPIPPLEELRKCIGPPLTSSFENRFGMPKEKSLAAVRKFRERYNVDGMFECAVYPGVEECIRKLKKKGCYISLASSKNEWACRKILAHFSLDTLFDDIVGSTEDAKIEMKKDIIEEFFARHPEKKKEETVLIGDTHFDAEGAVLADVNFIGVTYGFGEKQSLVNAGAKHIFDSAMEVCKYIEES